MNKEIKQETISKTTSYLNDANNAIKGGIYSDSLNKELALKHNVSPSLISFAEKAGLFKRVAMGKYTTSYHKIDPIHARRVIELRYQYMSKNKKETKKPTVSYKEKMTKLVKEQKHEPVQRKKTISILWGLIKITK